MKIALTIFKYFPYGGLQLDFGRIAVELVRRGHEVTAYPGKWEGETIPGVNVKIVPVHGFSNHRRAKSFEHNALKMVAAEKNDVICGFNRMAGLDVYFAADNCYRMENGMRAGWFKRMLSGRYRVYEEMERAVFQGNTMIMALTLRQIEDFMRTYGTSQERFLLLPPGIFDTMKRPDESEVILRRREIFSEFVLPEGSTLLLQICSGFATKGVDRTVTAVASLPDEIRKKVFLIVAGRENNPKFKQLALRLGVDKQVIFAGGRRDVARLISAADLMVHPARKEATGTVLAEALAGGLPVIASGCCGYAPMVTESGGRVLAEPFDQEELNRMLSETVSAPDMLEKMRQQACQYGSNGDFYRRAELAADFIERTAKR